MHGFVLPGGAEVSRGVGQGSQGAGPYYSTQLGPGGESPGTMLARAKAYDDVAFDLELRAGRYQPPARAEQPASGGSQPDAQVFATLSTQVAELRETASYWRDAAKAVLS